MLETSNKEEEYINLFLLIIWLSLKLQVLSTIIKQVIGIMEEEKPEEGLSYTDREKQKEVIQMMENLNELLEEGDKELSHEENMDEDHRQVEAITLQVSERKSNLRGIIHWICILL